MRRIFKYALKIEEYQQLSMQKGAHILAVMVQDGRLYLWADVNDAEGLCTRNFAVRGTGHPFPEIPSTTQLYVGSVIMGHFVWHVYELVRV